MRLDRRFRRGLYATVAVLFITGLAWLFADRLKEASVTGPWSTIAADLLIVHGGAAMLMLVLLGALMPFHVRVAWRRGRNRLTGTFMLASNGLLVATAFGLYYLGSETLRHWTSLAHVVVGIGLPVLLTCHVVVGRRVVRAHEHERRPSLAGSSERARP